MKNITAIPTRSWFSDEELQCKCSRCVYGRVAGENRAFNADHVDESFLRHLNRLREFWYCKSMLVSSAFRCFNHPLEEKKRKAALKAFVEFVPGDHPCGVGVDIRVAGAEALALMEAAGAYNFAHLEEGLPRPFTAISPNQRGAHEDRFVHLGGNVSATHRPRPYTWTY